MRNPSVRRPRRLALALLALLTALIFSGLAHANEGDPAPQLAYFLADDDAGIAQVYQLLLDGQSAPRQITRAERDVVTFGASHDGLAVAYLSNGQLWLQPTHTEGAEALTEVNNTVFFTPVFSPDGQYLAYASQGVWLYDLGARETHEILDDVPLTGDSPDFAAYRLYRPERFVIDADGRASHLIVRVGVWEWETPGVYTLATGDYQELDGQVHTDLLPLSDGRALLYGNGGVAGEFALHLATSLDDINTYERLLDFADLTDETLYARTAVEIRPGVVRVFGPSSRNMPEEENWFAFDYDLATGEAGAVSFLPLPPSTTGISLAEDLSPDGALVPVYADALWNDYGGLYGQFSLRDLSTGEAINAAFPESVGEFRWAR